MFAQAFGDLDRVGTKTLGNLTSMMKNFYEASKNDLDPTQLREVVRIIQNLEEQSWERSPFAAIKEGINDILTGTREVQAAEANLAAARAAQAEVEKRNASEIAILRLQMSPRPEPTRRGLRYSSGSTILSVRIGMLSKNTQQAVEDLAAAEYKVQTGFTKTKAALNNKMDAYLGNLSSDIGKIGDAMNTFSDIFGSAFGEEASAMIQDIQKGFQAVQAGIALVNTVMSIADAKAKELMTTMPRFLPHQYPLERCSLYSVRVSVESRRSRKRRNVPSGSWRTPTRIWRQRWIAPTLRPTSIRRRNSRRRIYLTSRPNYENRSTLSTRRRTRTSIRDG